MNQLIFQIARMIAKLEKTDLQKDKACSSCKDLKEEGMGHKNEDDTYSISSEGI